MPGDEPQAPSRGDVMRLAISAQARVIKAADINGNEEEPENG